MALISAAEAAQILGITIRTLGEYVWTRKLLHPVSGNNPNAWTFTADEIARRKGAALEARDRQRAWNGSQLRRREAV